MTEIKVQDGHGGSITMLEVNGYRYPKFTLDIIRGVPDLHIRPDDVIVCAYPKSGTHWVWEIIRQLLALKKTKDGKYELGTVPLKEKDVGFLEMNPQEEFLAQTSPRVLNTHVYFEQLPRQVMTSRCRLVTLVRDPRDVAVSYYHHHSGLDQLYHYRGEWGHYLPLFVEGKLDYGSWFDYHLSWERGLREHPELPVLSLSYEHLKQDSLAAIRQLAQFLDVSCSEEAMRAVDRACSFDVMKQTKGHLDTNTTGQPVMYRKGKVGDWKTVFTVAQAEQFSALYKTKLQDFLALTSSSDVKSSVSSLAAAYNVDAVDGIVKG